MRGFCQFFSTNGVNKEDCLEFVQILDAGTVAMPNSFSKIIGAMILEPDIGGACGEIQAHPKPNDISDTIMMTLLMKIMGLAQYFEYKMGHFLDKCYESLFGFISVLPGAFSTY